MTVVCPTVTAYDTHEYREQIERIQGFARRIHVDLMDGIFTEMASPPIDQLWLPEGIVGDVHLMYQRPVEVMSAVFALKPSLVIVQAEADDAEEAVVMLKQAGIKAGVAILADTEITSLGGIIEQADHVLIFSGHLGYHGGEADLGLLRKVAEVRERNATAELAWDGGINADNAAELITGGITVLNAGGFIQHAPVPEDAYAILESIIKDKQT